MRGLEEDEERLGEPAAQENTVAHRGTTTHGGRARPGGSTGDTSTYLSHQDKYIVTVDSAGDSLNHSHTMLKLLKV